MKKPRLLLADDHKIVLEGLRGLVPWKMVALWLPRLNA